jgi:hypothetical protein
MKRMLWAVSWLALVGLSCLAGTQPVLAALVACPYYDCKTVNSWTTADVIPGNVAKAPGSRSVPKGTNPPDSSHAIAIDIYARAGNEKFPRKTSGVYDNWSWQVFYNCPNQNPGAQFPQETTYNASQMGTYNATLDNFVCNGTGS